VRVGIKPNTPEWLGWRAEGITASDTAAILGLSPWSSPFDLWWRKRADRDTLEAGGELSDDFERSQRYAIGHALEPVLERFFIDEVSAPMARRVGSGGCWQGKGDGSWMRATPDRMVYPNLQTRTPSALVEFKTSSQHGSWGDDDGSGLPDIPVAYRAQIVHQMLVCGVQRAWLTVLLPSMQIRHYEILATDTELNLVFEAAEAFHRSLESRIPPDVDGHEATTTRLKAMWQDSDDTTVTVDDDLAEWLWDTDQAAKAAAADLRDAKNRVLEAIGNGRTAVTADGRKVASRSVSHRRATDAPAVRDALASLARDFPFDDRVLTAVAPDPTITLRPAKPARPKPQPIEETS
jgi:putative phage-type endonuclease